MSEDVFVVVIHEKQPPLLLPPESLCGGGVTLPLLSTDELVGIAVGSLLPPVGIDEHNQPDDDDDATGLLALPFFMLLFAVPGPPNQPVQLS